jgi:putative sterol carrier protein
LVEVTTLAVSDVRVVLAGGAESGLANIVQQFLEQDLSEFEDKRRQAARLHGQVTLSAADHDTSVTLEFKGHEIAIWDGHREPVDASIAGPYRQLVRLLQGEGNPLLEHFRGRLRVKSSLRKPFFPLRVHNLMKLPPEKGYGRTRQYILVAGLAGAATAAVVAAVLLIS